jgi:hypothetical protein
MTELDGFTRQYLETALWSSNDESDESGGKPMDRNYGVEDFAPESLEIAVRDCERFRRENAADLEGLDETDVAHDFWLTRNGHGAGFWDGDYDEAVGERLTAACEGFGECDAYIGDDGRVYLTGGDR